MDQEAEKERKPQKHLLNPVLKPTGQSATPLQGVLTVSDFVALSCLTLRAKLRGIREGKESGCVFIRDTASMQEKGVESATASKQH